MADTRGRPHATGVAALFDPRSIAVIGASDTPGNLGGRIIGFLDKLGYPGAILPVNPRQAQVAGRMCHADLSALPEVPDLALVTVGAPLAVQAVRDCIAAGIGAGIVFAGGFAETGDEGRARQDELTVLCRSAGFALCGPNTLGIIDPLQPLAASFGSQLIPMASLRRGNVALISQSGGTAATIHEMLNRSGIGLRAIVSAGNEAVLGVPDYLRHFCADAATKVIGLYVEGARDGADFVDALERLRASGKTAVMLKSGAGEAGARAAAAHTGALAGAARVWSAVLAEFGVIEVRSVATLAQCLAVLSERNGARLRPGPVVLAAPTRTALAAAERQARSAGLRLATSILLDESTAPLVEAMADPSLSAVVFAGTEAEGCAAGLLELPPGEVPLIAALSGADAMAFSTAGRAPVPDVADAIAVVALLQMPVSRPLAVRPQPLAFDWSGVRALARTGVIAEHDCHALLERAGLPVARGRVATSADQARAAAEEVGLPVAMKAVSDNVTHRAAAGLLELDIETPGAVAATYGSLVARAEAAGARLQGIYVQTMERDGVELLVSALRDPLFGTVVTVGAGGTATETLDDVRIARAPVAEADALALVEGLRIGALARRMRPDSDPAAMARLVSDFSRLASSAPWPAFAFEMNPVIWRGDEVVAVDGLIVIDQTGEGGA